MAKNEVAVKSDNQIVELSDFLMEDVGKGISSAPEDNIVPLIYVLQALSPAVIKRNASYVEGAEPGDLLKKNSVHNPVVKGDEGLLFQPCYFEKVWIEWRPNRGGFVAAHKEKPVDAREEEIMVEGRPRKAWMRTNGNLLVETRQHMGFADGEPYVIPFSSTGHTVSRTWMQMMNQQYIPGTTKIAASFAKKYRLTTVERTKDSNTWYVIKVDDLGRDGWISSREEYERGKKLYEAFARGEKQVASAEMDDHEQVSEPF